MSGMMYTCGSMLAGFKDPTNPKNCCYYILDKYIVRANNTCARPVQRLYYTCNYTDCWCYCGSKQQLKSQTNNIQCVNPAKNASSIEPKKKKGANIMNPMILFLFLFLKSLYFD